jgi:hypothetical protein
MEGHQVMDERGPIIVDASAFDVDATSDTPLTAADLEALRRLELTSCDFVGDYGCNDPTCWQCHSPVGPANLRSLAKNLAIAAMLCRAWQLGWVAGSDPRMGGDPEWRPGCGSPPRGRNPRSEVS